MNENYYLKGKLKSIFAKIKIKNKLKVLVNINFDK